MDPGVAGRTNGNQEIQVVTPRLPVVDMKRFRRATAAALVAVPFEGRLPVSAKALAGVPGAPDTKPATPGPRRHRPPTGAEEASLAARGHHDTPSVPRKIETDNKDYR